MRPSDYSLVKLSGEKYAGKICRQWAKRCTYMYDKMGVQTNVLARRPVTSLDVSLRTPMVPLS